MLCGCHPPGKPGPGPEVGRPDQLLDFKPLYAQNCAACHGADGRNGAALSLANPVYLATAGEANIRNVISKGVDGTSMPPFSRPAGGMLTDQQINVLTTGMLKAWGNTAVLGNTQPLPYAATSQGDPTRGAAAFRTYCAQCHGADGTGARVRGTPVGSIVDPAYLALISNQGLRSIVLAGIPGQGMPDWRSDAGQAMTDQQITDIVAWLASHRTNAPGQPYPDHQ
jgi:cytochrome c oxidase cbb3-type subunit 3/ubiquinol-cytochrome c reductase cytochrome c subunit